MTSIDYGGRAEFYDIEYTTDADRAFLESFVDFNVRSVLEVPCGSGRNLRWLAATGREVCAADYEIAMAARARVAHNDKNVQVVVADIRNLPFRRGFDLIIVPQGGLQLLEPRDATAALRNIGEQLSYSGRAIIDIATFNASSTSDASVRPSYFDPSCANGVERFDWTRPLPGGQGTLTRSHVQYLGEDKLGVEFRYTLNDARGERHLRFEMQIRRWTHAELTTAMHAVGLEVEATYTDYRLDRVGVKDLATADRVILLARRGECQTIR